MYTDIDFKSKKALKEAVALRAVYRDKLAVAKLAGAAVLHDRVVPAVTYYQPNDMGFTPLPTHGRVFIEGPHSPKPHSWYAECTVENGEITRVR